MINDLVFDLDDTLVKTNQHYMNTEKYLIDLYKEYPQISEKEIRELIKEEDMKLIKSHKYGYHWFKEGLTEVYKRLKVKYGIEINNFSENFTKKVEDEFLQTPELWDNAQKILTHFYELKKNLYIMTLGENQVQTPKIEKAGIKHFFKKIYIVSKKDDKDYSDIIADSGINPRESYFIGNSIYSDMIPAKRAGFNCILFDKFTTFYNMKIELPDNILIIKDLIELIDLIK